MVGNLLLGHIRRTQGEPDSAFYAYYAAAKARPNEGAAAFFMAEAHKELGHLLLAQDRYHEAAALNPLESQPLLALGQLQWDRNEHIAALESFQLAVEATPGWDRAHVALGNALLAIGDSPRAAKHYSLAQITRGDLNESVILDFASGVAKADVRSSAAEYVRNDEIAINGDRRQVLFGHPKSTIRYPVDVSDDTLLAFAVATMPESWTQSGDGVTFNIYVESGEGAKTRQRVFTSHIDPKHNYADQRWLSYTVDLHAWAGQSVTIVFETEAGSAGDDRYDWAVWGAPRMIRR
jgi:tetratricopeptide (TPR) repeat protein